MTEREYRRLVNRQYRLPWQLERARDRLTQLEAERAWSALSAEGRVTHSERRSRLPAMIAAQRRKVKAYETEACRIGMPELLGGTPSLDHAWEREAALAARALEGGRA